MSVFKKTLLTLGFSALGFSAIFIVSMLVFFNSLYYELNTESLKNTANALMEAIGNDRLNEIFSVNTHNNGDFIQLQKIDLPVGVNGAYRLTLIFPSGYVLWDSHVTERLVNHIDREEIRAALEGREGSARRYSVSTGMMLIYYAMPVFDSEENVTGVFRLSFLIPGFWARLSSVLFPFLIFSVLMAVLVFFAIYKFSSSISVSLGRLVNITKTGASLLSNPDAGIVAPEFLSLEKAIRAMTYELNFRLEQAKTESYRLEAILNGMSEAVFAMDSNLKLHLVNPKAREIFNIGNRDIIGLSLLEATHSAELTEAAKKALVSGAVLEMELSFHTGTEQQFQVYVSPLMNVKSGGVVLVLQDITRLVKLERIRKDFVANVSHELRTPIQLIKGFSETLYDAAGESDDSARHFIEIIRKNTGVMENLTNDLLTLASLENNDKNLNPFGIQEMEEQNIITLINEAVLSLEPQAKRKNIEIIVDCADDINAFVYSSSIVQALINLIDNAIKYSSSKSKIWVSAFMEKEELVLQVRDKGIGIPPEHLDRIFERFYRVDRARSREAGGTGLGLSIVRHIALLHRGKAEAESHSGEGSAFRIRIPAVHPYP